MQQLFLILTYVICFISQCFITYNALTMAECQEIKSQFAFQIPRENIEIFSIMIVISLPLLLLFQYFKRYNLQCIQMFLTSLFFIIINGYIAGLGFILMHKIIEIKNRKFVDPIYRNCDEVNYLYSTQLTMLIIWQITFAFIYLQLNRKLNSIVELFGYHGLVVRLIFIDVSVACFTYSIYLLQIQNNIIESDVSQLYKDKNKSLVFLYFWFLQTLLLLSMLYLIKLQLQEVFGIYRVRSVKNKTLKMFIWLALISSLFLVFSPFIYQNFILIYLIIQLNGQQRFDIDMNQNENDRQTEIIQCLECLECQEQFTFNDQIIYLDNPLYIFHHNCYPIWQQLQYLQYDKQYSIDLRTQKIEKEKHDEIDIYVFYFINWITSYFIVMDHGGDKIYDSQLMDIIYSQAFILVLFTLFSKIKMIKLSFLLFFILCCSQFFNLRIIYFIYQESAKKYQETLKKFELYYFSKVTKLFIFLVIITFIQAYQFSSIINFKRIQKKYYMVGFVFFILMNIQSIILFIIKFENSYFNYVVVIIFLLNLFVLTYYFINQIKNRESFTKIINSLFMIKTIVVLLIFLIIIALNGEYKKFWGFLINFEDLQYIAQKLFEVRDYSNIRLAYLLLTISQIFYLIWLYYIETTFLMKCQQTLFSDRQLINYDQIRQNIIILNCQSCLLNFQKGQVIIFNIECKHFIHKQCIKVKWINYQWCCENAEGKYIEIILQ